MLRLDDYATDQIELVGEPENSERACGLPVCHTFADHAKERPGVPVGRIRLVGWRFGAVAAEAPIVSSAVPSPLIEPISIHAVPGAEAGRVVLTCGNPASRHDEFSLRYLQSFACTIPRTATGKSATKNGRP